MPKGDYIVYYVALFTTSFQGGLAFQRLRFDKLKAPPYMVCRFFSDLILLFNYMSQEQQYKTLLHIPVYIKIHFNKITHSFL